MPNENKDPFAEFAVEDPFAEFAVAEPKDDPFAEFAVTETTGLADKVEPNIVGDQSITQDELNQVAKQHKVDPELLREYANWAGANTEMRPGVTGFGGWQEFKDNLKQTVGEVGNTLGFGLNKIAAKKMLSDEPGFRKAADEINALSSRKQSYLSDVTDIGAQVATGGALSKGAQAASKLPAMAKKLYDPITAVTGSAAAGLGASEEGHELEDTAMAGAAGALGYGVFAGAGRLLSRSGKETLPIVPSEQGKAAKAMDKYLGTLSTRIGNISPEIKYKLRKFEHDTTNETARLHKDVLPFIESLSKVKGQPKDEISKHLFNGRLKEAKEVMDSVDPKMGSEFELRVLPILDDLSIKLKDAGHGFAVSDEYFPRNVKDYQKLRSALGKNEQDIIEKQVVAYAKSKKIPRQKVTAEEESKIINDVITGNFRSMGGKTPGFAKQRTISEIDDELLKHYNAPEDSLAAYVRNAVHDIEKRKFFGKVGRKDAASIDEMGQFDTEDSIGRMIADLSEEGKFTVSQRQELAEMLNARFTGEKQAPGKAAQVYRDLGYMGTLTNVPMSAMTQLGDLSVTAALKGYRNTLESMFGKNKISLEDLNLEDTISKEFGVGESRKTAKVLDKLLRGTGFKQVDKFGKTVYINAAVRKAQKQVQTDKGIKELTEKVKPIFGDETDQFTQDLLDNKMTENVKLWVFNQLADIQPIALSEMPEAYLRAKNGRLAYMLKSFTLKQLDVVRREVVQEYLKGNKKQAVIKAASLASAMGAANMSIGTVKDLLRGRDVSPEEIPSKFMWAILGTYGLNEYVFEKHLKKGKIVEGAMTYVTPAGPVFDSMATLAAEAFEEEPEFEKALKGVPIAGSLLYDRLGGGSEKYNEYKQRREGKNVRRRTRKRSR